MPRGSSSRSSSAAGGPADPSAYGSPVRIDVVTIFPAYLAPLREALLGRAIGAGLVDLAGHDLRSWTRDVHQAVDDSPYGGGPGMVMRPQVWGEALDTVLEQNGPARLVVPTPAGSTSATSASPATYGNASSSRTTAGACAIRGE